MTAANAANVHLQENDDTHLAAANAGAGAGAARGKLEWRNWSNLIAYIANLVVTYISLTGVFGETNADLSKKYQTLVTPAGWAFSIWGLIFVGELAFAVAQMLPRYRARELVVISTPFWLATCGFQICWTLAFASEVIWLSVVFMLGILASLLAMALRVDSVPQGFEDVALFRAPFALHAGWIVAASAVNINVLADAWPAQPQALLGLAIMSLAAVLIVSTLFAVAVKTPDPLIPTVAAWALAAIASELKDPLNLNSPDRFNPYTWDQKTLEGLRIATIGLSILAAALAVFAAVSRARAILRR